MDWTHLLWSTAWQDNKWQWPSLVGDGQCYVSVTVTKKNKSKRSKIHNFIIVSSWMDKSRFLFCNKNEPICFKINPTQKQIMTNCICMKDMLKRRYLKASLSIIPLSTICYLCHIWLLYLLKNNWRKILCHF